MDSLLKNKFQGVLKKLGVIVLQIDINKIIRTELAKNKKILIIIKKKNCKRNFIYFFYFLRYIYKKKYEKKEKKEKGFEK